jgi:hypothetical protein
MYGVRFARQHGGQQNSLQIRPNHDEDQRGNQEDCYNDKCYPAQDLQCVLLSPFLDLNAKPVKGEGWGGAAELHPTRSPTEMDEEQGLLKLRYSISIRIRTST